MDVAWMAEEIADWLEITGRISLTTGTTATRKCFAYWLVGAGATFTEILPVISAVRRDDRAYLAAWSDEEQHKGNAVGLTVAEYLNGVLDWSKLFYSIDRDYGQRHYTISVLRWREETFRVTAHRLLTTWNRPRQYGDLTVATVGDLSNGALTPRYVTLRSGGQLVLIETLVEIRIEPLWAEEYSLYTKVGPSNLISWPWN